MERVAIVGTGVAGLGCAWNLRDHAHITLLDKDSRHGGHTNTVVVDENGRPVPIDTGFIVFNKVTYPHLCRLFSDLKVPIKPAEMSFSVQHLPTGLEYNGMGINKVFAQRRNLFRPRFHRLLGQIQRFFRVAVTHLENADLAETTVREFATLHDFDQDFLDLYLVPMSSAVWSTEPHDVLNFPAATLLRFFHNHGFLGVDTHHPWFTVDGGAKIYVDRILAAVGGAKVNAGVESVDENSDGVQVALSDGSLASFDRVILACHADQALRMLARPDPDQSRLLGAFRYQSNHATLHTDRRVMPRQRRAWASWNYRVGPDRSTTHYWMNALQGVSQSRDYFVSLNCEGEFPPEDVLYQTRYDHPVFSVETQLAQRELPTLNTRNPDQRVYFCGSYFRYGFHEDAYASAVDLAAVLRENLRVRAP